MSIADLLLLNFTGTSGFDLAKTGDLLRPNSMGLNLNSEKALFVQSSKVERKTERNLEQ